MGQHHVSFFYFVQNMPNERFSLTLQEPIKENLLHYVYLLIDPRTDNIFYVGKGYGNRINQHLSDALEAKTIETKKILTIRAIEQAGLEVKLVILRHKLNSKEAFEVESAVIDLLEKRNLTNIVSGHDSEGRGKMSLREIRIKYEADPANITEPVMLININKLYNRDVTENELYEATRKHWKINIKRANKVKIVCSVFRGIVREVYCVDCWMLSQKIEGKKIFKGKIAPDEVRQKYLDKSVTPYWKKGSRFPIKYVNC